MYFLNSYSAADFLLINQNLQTGKLMLLPSNAVFDRLHDLAADTNIPLFERKMTISEPLVENP
jgi:hypothetical protein